MYKDYVINTLKVLSDEKSLFMFETIAAKSAKGLTTSELNNYLKLTVKRLYSRISSLRKAGLVKRQNGRYSLTSFGILVVASLEILSKASLYYHKLIAIDAVQTSDINNNFTKLEIRKIVEALITNQQIKEVLLGAHVLKLT
jgi:predicted transcriptional regulator